MDFNFKESIGWKLNQQMERNDYFLKRGKLPDDSNKNSNKRELPFPELLDTDNTEDDFEL